MSPRLNDQTKVSTDLRSVIAAVTFVVGMTILGTTLYIDLQKVKNDVSEIKTALGLDKPRVVLPSTSVTTNRESAPKL